MASRSLFRVLLALVVLTLERGLLSGRRFLEELVFLSPYAVTRGRPCVRPGPGDPTTWWMQARRLDAKGSRALKRTLIERTTARLQS